MTTEKIKVLQFGNNNWANFVSQNYSNKLDWSFFNIQDFSESSISILLKITKKKSFDVVICTNQIPEKILKHISKSIEAYNIIIDQKFELTTTDYIKDLMHPFFIDTVNKDEVLRTLSLYFFSGQGGTKLKVSSIVVNDYFSEEIILQGEHRMELSGKFSRLQSNPLLTWKNDIFVNDRSQKIWLEFTHSASVAVSLTILGTSYQNGNITKIWQYSEEEIKQGIELHPEKGVTHLSATLSVDGDGWLHVGPLHFRESRGPYGEFLLGGKKIFDHQNEELFYYFNPGDLKPPLNIYFSGYRSLEGFEGFYMMKQLGAPFLLISDPRLEGGSFYLGSGELEQKLISVIHNYLDDLGFTNNELIMSGLSMGAFGALYYSSYFSPHAVILGKPLANLGNIAINGRLKRPGVFSTSFDILNSLTGSLSEHSVTTLNHRFWHRFDQADFKNTQFVISYMKNDDYDDLAYDSLLEHLSYKEAVVIGKGTVGRHNDNFNGLFNWLIKQYGRLLLENFGRNGKNDV